MQAPLQNVRGEVFNIGLGRAISVIDIAKTISALFGAKEKFEFIHERFGQVQKHISSTEKAKSDLGFRPNMSFEDGLQKTIQWYQGNRPLWEKQIPLRRVPVKTKDGKLVWY